MSAAYDDHTDPYAGQVPEPEETTVAMSPEGITWLSTLIDKFGWDRINQAMFASPLWEMRKPAGRAALALYDELNSPEGAA